MDDEIVSLLRESVENALHRQDDEAKEAKDAAEKTREYSQDSARRQWYREAQDHDSEPSNSEKEASKALSQVRSESSVAPTPQNPRVPKGPRRRTWRSAVRNWW